MDPDDDRHGTYAGAMQHTRRGEPMCGPCKAARNDYMRQHRETNAVSYNRNKRKQAAASRARTRLAHMFPDAYRALVDEELRKAGK